MLELHNINKIFTVDSLEIKAVDDVSMKVEKGDFLSIIGHSGSGKTTLLSIIGGILRPTSGKVFFGGSDVYALDDNGLSEYRAEKVGYVFQFASLLPVLTAKENLLLPTIFKHTVPGGSEKKAEEYLDMVGLKDKINAYPSQLSGGQQRRVAIARALMNKPDIILADEPTGDLDEETEAEAMNFFRYINETLGITFVLVTHSTELAKNAKRKMRMSDGKLTEL
jgi:putative ABC transport system ATP-binding protein/lipoprotein-releasing system ATP-binding protein